MPEPQTPFLLTVVLPVANESATLPKFYGSLRRYLDSEFGNEPIEVILVNNGSTDDTSAVASSIFAQGDGGRVSTVYREYPWRDYSEAVRQAVLLAGGEYIVWLGVDIDDIASIGRGLRALKESQADLAILSKYRGADWRPAKRVLMNRAFNFLARTLDGLWFSDIEGYMMVTKRMRPLFESLGFSRGNTLNLNLLYFSKKLGVRIVEAPFYVTENRKSVFLRSLPQVAWLDLRSMVGVHLEFKRFAEMRSHQNPSLRQS